MIHLPSGRVYIGQRKVPKGVTPENDSYHGSGKIWKRIYNKHSDECIKVIIDYADTKDEIDELEKKYIAHYRAVMGEYCVNVADGGGGCKGYKHTKETKELLSKLAKGNTRCKGKHHSEETKEKLRKAREGYKFSEEWCKKISEKVKGEGNPMFGKKQSKETRKKISLANKGNKHTQEWKDKMSARYSGQNNPNYGRKHTPEAIEKMREAARKRSRERDEFGRFKKKGTRD